MRKLLKQKVTGFRITPWIRGKGNKAKWLDGDGMARVVRKVVERMAPLVGIMPRPRDEEQGIEQHLIPANFRGAVFAAH